MSTTGPIADLTYRNYDGPKGVAVHRWWVIAKNGIRMCLKKKIPLALLVLFNALPYFMLMILTFLQSASGGRGPEELRSMLDFPSLLSGNYNRGFGALMLALFIGAGAIAADNRASALQVYLSKPLTKRDYLIGKWSFVFIMLFTAYFAPMFLATLYQAMANGMGDFIRDQPLLFPKLLLLAALPAAVHSTCIIGLSAWNKTPWVVGVTYAGFLTFTQILALMFATTESGSAKTRATIELMHIDGAITGLGRCIIGKVPRTPGGDMELSVLPYWQPLLAVLAIVMIVAWLMARARIRAVEVVQG